MGRSLEDVRAVVLTHAHTDHIGFAERTRTERGVPIRVHELDELRAKGLFWASSFGLRNGLLRVPPILEVATFGDGATLDVPGAARVIRVPVIPPGAPRCTSRSAMRCASAMRS